MQTVTVPKHVSKILIVKPSALGDIVHSLPFLSSVTRCFPDAEVHWVVARGLDGFLEGHPLITKLWVINKDQWKQIKKARDTAKEIRTLFRELRGEHFDIAIDLQGLLRSGLITMATRAKCRLGFREAREGSTVFYTHKVPGGRDIHAIDRYLKIAAFLGCGTEVEYPFPPLPPVSSIGVELPKDYAVIAPSAGKQANRWPAERFGQLASRLPVKSVIVSSGKDEPIAEEVVAASKGKALSLAGRTSIKQMASVIRNARFFVSNDTGPMHIAAAFNVPVFAIFGPANPVRTGPHGYMHTVIREDLDCSPCYRKTKCKNWRCMEDISVDKVYDSIKKSGMI